MCPRVGEVDSLNAYHAVGDGQGMDDETLEEMDALIGYLRNLGLSAYFTPDTTVRIYDGNRVRRWFGSSPADKKYAKDLAFVEFRVVDGKLLPVGPWCKKGSEICLASGSRNIKERIKRCLQCELSGGGYCLDATPE